jgi:nitrogen regulatory protein PII
MKIVFVICNEVFEDRVYEILDRVGIDYFTCWERVKGKGHGTEPHLGTRAFPGMNAVLMIAIKEEPLLTGLVAEIEKANTAIVRADDHIRLFQVPLERII